MSATLRHAAAALSAASAAFAALPAAAFEAAPSRLETFRSAESAITQAAPLVAERAEVFAPLALVLVAALYVAGRARLFGA